MKQRTAYNGLVKIDTNGKRLVTDHAKSIWKDMEVKGRFMLVTAPIHFKPVSGGYVLLFSVLDQMGHAHQSNIMIGDVNRMVEDQCRIIRCKPADLKNTEDYSWMLNNLVGRVLRYSIHDSRWIRPVMSQPEPLGLNRFIEQYKDNIAA